MNRSDGLDEGEASAATGSSENDGRRGTHDEDATEAKKRSTLRDTKSLRVVVVVLLFALAWEIVDANWTLFLYDVLLTATPSRRYRHLEGKSVWVTGASSGIGAELACILLVEAGAGHVVLSARRRDAIERVVEGCLLRRSQPSTSSVASATTHSIVTYDAARPNASDDVVRNVLASTPESRLDFVVLNAGMYQLSPALETPRTLAERIMTVNFHSPVSLVTSLIEADGWKGRIEEGGGGKHVLVTSSVMGRGGNALSSSYSATKHALRGYFHSLSTEEWDWLRVDVSCPGAADTNLWGALPPHKHPVASNPAGKVSPRRVARLMLTGTGGPHFLFYETWISKQPGLLWVYTASYAPELFYWIIHVFGKLRVDAWRDDGSDAVDVASFVKQIMKALFQG